MMKAKKQVKLCEFIVDYLSIMYISDGSEGDGNKLLEWFPENLADTLRNVCNDVDDEIKYGA